MASPHLPSSTSSSCTSFFIPSPPQNKPFINHLLEDSSHSRRPARKKGRSHRFSRLSREKQIPALNIHLAQFPCPDSRLRGKLRYLFDHEPDPSQSFPPVLFRLRSGLVELPDSPREILLDGFGLDEIDNRSLNADVTHEIQSSDGYSGGEGDISEAGSDTGRDLFELHHCREGSASPVSYEGPTVTRAASECSSDSDDKNTLSKTAEAENWSMEDWKLQAELLMAECNLLRVEKELAVRRWKQGSVEIDKAVHMAQVLHAALRSMPVKGKTNFDASGYWESPQHGLREQPEDLHERLDKIQTTLSYSEQCRNSSFTREALKRLQKLQNFSKISSEPSQDPTDALQERLQNLLLAAHDSAEHRSPERVVPFHKFDDVWETTKTEDFSTESKQAAAEEKGCLVQNAAMRKQLDLLSLELSETKATAALIRKEYRSMLSEEKSEHDQVRISPERPSGDQAVRDEMFCKAVIRQITAQVQAETEQWTQVQDILHNLQEEMEDLHEAREIWEERALNAEAQLFSLQETVHDWRCRAQIAEEEVASLQLDRQNLSKKVEKLKHRHAVERSRWLEHEESRLKEAATVSTTCSQKSKYGVCEVEERPRHASVGIQDGYDICESIIHSRNGSNRSSLDMDMSQKGSRKNIKKSLDFSNEGNSKVRLKYHHTLSDRLSKMEPTKEKKRKAKHFSFKESGPNTGSVTELQDENNCFKDNSGSFNPSKSKTSVAPAAKIRLPFGEIMNSAPSTTLK